MSGLLPKHVHEYLNALMDASLETKSHRGYAHNYSDRFTIEAGRKYLKVVQTNVSQDFEGNPVHGQRFVHAFIDKHTGDLIKAAGWAGPQRDKDGLAIRGNIADDRDRARIVTLLKNKPHYVHGHYLYDNVYKDGE